MDLSWRRIHLKLTSPFRTASAERTDKKTICVRLEHRGVEGWGEVVPMDTYGQSLESAEDALREIARHLAGDDLNPFHVEPIVEHLLSRFDGQRAAIAGVDAALHDWIGKKLDLPVSEYLGLDPSKAPATSFSIGIDEPNAIREKTRAAEAFPILKVKVGADRDEQTLAIIREIAPRKTIRVDANMAWSVEQALERIPRLAEYDIEFVEQPIPAGDNEGLRTLRDAAICPIVADESCIRPSDVPGLAGCVDGINIKLSKCGGVREALKMIHIARSLDMKIMLGCMIEGSLGIAAAAQLAPLADWLDLDGHLHLSQDAFTGFGGTCGRLRIGQSPGLGVCPI